MRRWLIGLLAGLSLLATACAAPPTPSQPSPAPSGASPSAQLTGELVVFAAASLTEAFREIGRGFEAAHPGARLTFNFAGSQQLVQQITQGAPADVFASAAPRQMEQAVDAQSVARDRARIFARNRLVVVYPHDNPRNLKSLADLAQPGVKLVLAAKEVPVGQYSLDFLDKAAREPALGARFKDAVLKNVVSYEENVRAVLGKVTLGEADAGIVYTSDINGDAAARVGRIDIPDALNTVAAYPIAPLTHAKNPDLARAFVDYVRGPEGQLILTKYGFIPAQGGE